MITGLMLCLLALSGFILLIMGKNYSGMKRLLFPSIFLLICFCINILSPGNAIRQAAVPHTPNVINAIRGSFWKGLYYTFFWCRLPVLGGCWCSDYCFGLFFLFVLSVSAIQGWFQSGPIVFSLPCFVPPCMLWALKDLVECKISFSAPICFCWL